MHNLKRFDNNTPLEEDEYLLKIRSGYAGDINTGYMTKLTKKKEIPLNFLKWGDWGDRKANYPIYVIKEEFRSGWKINDFRQGQSVIWGELIHPFGFTLEVYLEDLIHVIKTHTIVNGEIIGEFKWHDKSLVKK